MTDFERDIMRYFQREAHNIIILNTYVTKKIFKTKTFKNLKNENIELYPVTFKRGPGNITVKSTTAYVPKTIFDSLSIGDEAVVIYPRTSMESFRLVKGTYVGDLFETYSVRETNVDGVEERNILKNIKNNERNSFIVLGLGILGMFLSYWVCSLLIALGIIGFVLCLTVLVCVVLAFLKNQKLKKLLKTPGSVKILNTKCIDKDTINVTFQAPYDFKIFRHDIFGGNSTEINNECFVVYNKIDNKPLLIVNGQYTGNVFLTQNLL